MSKSELLEEISFGLQNLDKIYRNIQNFAQQENVDEELRAAALTYECFGYYNALEHLIIRILKHQSKAIPSGPFSHRDTLRTFQTFIAEKSIEMDADVIRTIENLMAFRHVATKIYSFLIDWDKLEVIIEDIKVKHLQIKDFFIQFSNR